MENRDSCFKFGGATEETPRRRKPVGGRNGARPVYRVSVAAPTAFGEDPTSLSKWARSQTGVADPLSQWSRDELLVAFRDFCSERDAWMRNAAALLKRAEGDAALREAVAGLPAELRDRLRAALERII